ncbi:hypothetical protein [Sutterella sp.]|uniref:hypothetical protein n=1 Tax=Sutterella sp. TaxID=1981025 RepID=UPI0026E04BCA|nr:hypothetical protein [Sutterella sp.]MDO5532871.1 hypothetical protein [Sutterella sp.]
MTETTKKDITFMSVDALEAQLESIPVEQAARVGVFVRIGGNFYTADENMGLFRRKLDDGSIFHAIVIIGTERIRTVVREHEEDVDAADLIAADLAVMN